MMNEIASDSEIGRARYYSKWQPPRSKENLLVFGRADIRVVVSEYCLM
jgi:hypothetical protein